MWLSGSLIPVSREAGVPFVEGSEVSVGWDVACLIEAVATGFAGVSFLTGCTFGFLGRGATKISVSGVMSTAF